MGRHTFRIREIAMQAGLSEATVDRVLNQRGNVRVSTEREVYQRSRIWNGNNPSYA
jgi:LacI family transcriptional regulator, galactose operon repressor